MLITSYFFNQTRKLFINCLFMFIFLLDQNGQEIPTGYFGIKKIKSCKSQFK